MQRRFGEIEDLIVSFLNEEELSDCFLIDIKLEEKKLEVFIDGDEGVSFKKCRMLSRKIEAFLDEGLMLGEKYKLDVSSPGASAPLKLLRQYPKHVGRKIKIQMKDGSELKGLFKSLEGSVLSIEKKIKKKEVELIAVDFLEIEKSFIELAF